MSVLKALSNLTVKSKLIGLALFSMLLIAGIVAVGMVNYLKISSALLVKDQIYVISEELLDARVAEKSYLQFHDKEYADSLVSIAARARESAEKLTQEKLGAAQQKLVGDISERTQNYSDKFNELVEVYAERVTCRETMNAASVQADEVLSKVLRTIGDLEYELMLDGDSLTAQQSAILGSAGDCRVYLAVANSMQKASVISGDLADYAAYTNYIGGSAALSLSALEVAANSLGTVRDVSMKDIAKAFLDSVAEYKTASGRAQDLFVQERAMTRELDAIGTATQEQAGQLIAGAAESVAATQRAVIRMITLFLVVGIFLFVVVVVIIIVSITRPISLITNVATVFQTGDFSAEISYRSKNEIGQLADAFRSMALAQSKKIDAAAAISDGDLSVQIELMSDRDALGKSLQSMVRVLQDVIRQNEVTCQAQQAGDLDARNCLDGLRGDYQTLAGGVNAALDSIALPIVEGIGMLNEYAQGDVSREMRELPGKQMMLTDGLRNIRSNLQNMIEDARSLAQAGAEGRLSFRADTTRLHGDFRTIIQGINDTLDHVLVPMQEGMEVISRLSQSEFVRMEKEYPGDYAVIRRNVNHVSDPLATMTGEFEGLAAAVKEGDLAFRANAEAFDGAYRRIVDVVNASLEAVATPIREAGEVLGAAAEQDLTVRVRGRYNGQLAEFKDNVNTTIERLNDALGQVALTVSQVNSGAEQISDASQSLSQGATEQASSLQEITSSMAEIASQAKTNAENANQANSLADAVRKSAEKGSAQMTQMTGAMDSINASSAQIAKIIKVIDDIAFQTNLLALNAAVEAARAGRHGKGFAVVADEVRNLAGRSAKAAKETAELIESSGAKANAGMQVANATAESFKDIVDGIVKTNDLVGEIAAASSEQAQGVSQINIGLSQVDQVTQQNTANAEETASAAQELSSQSVRLHTLVAKFRLSGAAEEGEAKSSGRALPAASESSWGHGDEASNDKSIMKWSEEFSVGNGKMDAQHKRLFGLINKVYGALQSGKGNEQALAILEELADYTQTHFSEEEALMRLYNYPGLDEQVETHRAFVQKVVDLQESARKGQPLGARVFIFLKDWLTTHICKLDKQYSDYLPE